MIVASLLLILVAVTLLVLGLAGGSSTLLISSIVASLLAAVALVVGARHTAAQRRAGAPRGAAEPVEDRMGEPVGAGTRAGRYATAGAGRFAGRRSAPGRPDPDPAGTDTGAFDEDASDPRGASADVLGADASAADVRGAGASAVDRADFDAPVADRADRSGFASPTADGSGFEAPVSDRAGFETPDSGRADDDQFADASVARDGGVPHAGSDFSRSDLVPDDLAGSDHGGVDAGHDRVSGPGRAPSDLPPSADHGPDPAGFADHGPDPAGFADQQGAGPADGHATGRRSGEPDYDRASSVIGAARSADPRGDAWHPLGADEPAERTPDDPDAFDSGREASGAGRAGFGSDAGGHPFDEPGVFDRPGAPGQAGAFDRPGAPGQAGAFDRPGAPDQAGAFDRPDDDDPADEPLPQAVRPGDAVRVAQMEADVVVVDGRPRYHMADCDHLAGRLSEPLPVREAVELGFSPCGRCRPVDRLVGQTARR